MKKQNTIVTIEKTSKKYKGCTVISWGLIVIGSIGIFSGTNLTFGMWTLFIGVGIGIYAKIGAWWNNG